MISNREFLTKKFGTELNKKLKLKFGKKISSAKFADQFNLRAYGTSTITRETARKWLNGECIPDLDKFPVLIEWLDLDVSKIIQSNSKEKEYVATRDDYDLLNELFYLFNEFDIETRKIAILIAGLITKNEMKPSPHQNNTLEIVSRIYECSICPFNNKMS